MLIFVVCLLLATFLAIAWIELRTRGRYDPEGQVVALLRDGLTEEATRLAFQKISLGPMPENRLLCEVGLKFAQIGIRTLELLPPNTPVADLIDEMDQKFKRYRAFLLDNPWRTDDFRGLELAYKEFLVGVARTRHEALKELGVVLPEPPYSGGSLDFKL